MEELELTKEEIERIKMAVSERKMHWKDLYLRCEDSMDYDIYKSYERIENKLKKIYE